MMVWDKEHSKVWQFYKDHHLGTKTHEYRDSSTTTTIRMSHVASHSFKLNKGVHMLCC